MSALPAGTPGPRALRSLPARGWRWAFAAVPLVGLLELGAHLQQTHSVVPASDWLAARGYVEAHAKPEDLVVFAPWWADPIGRERFGTSIATFEREGRGDDSRFPRALEVSIRGAHLPELAGWARDGEEHFGGVTVTTLLNRRASPVIDDLVSMVDPGHMKVWRIDGPRESACAFTHGAPQAGALGFGPAIPGDRFGCPGEAVGVSVMADLDYHPRRCIYAPAPGPGSRLRIRFLGVRMGRTLYGHHGIYVEAERNRTGSPVTIRFTSGDAAAGVAASSVGTVVHHDGDGWKAFEFDTSDLAGQTVDLEAEISAPAADRRMYCFEASTR